MDSSIIGRVREQIGRLGWSSLPKGPSQAFTTDSGELTKVLIGASTVGSGSELPDSLLAPAPQPAHALYTITLPARTSFPTDIAYASIVIQVDAGSVRVVSPKGHAKVYVGTGNPITGDDHRTVWLASGSATLGMGEGAYLSAGNAISSADEALEVTGSDQGAKLTVSTVIAAPDLNQDLCWICPGRTTS
jgi:hypothetical protein